MYRRLLTGSSLSFNFFKKTTRYYSKMASLPERYFADQATPFSRLEAKPFFETLSLKEKQYAHYMSRAAFEGTRIIITQTNPNALAIYDLILKSFSDDNGNMVHVDTLRTAR
jgi:dipeptidyl-peptidase-3